MNWYAVENQIDELCTMANKTAHDKGWWDSPRSDGEVIALMHSELSECLEALRHGNKRSEHIPQYSGAEEELADVLIRIFDFCGERHYDLGGALEAKMEYNKRLDTGAAGVVG